MLAFDSSGGCIEDEADEEAVAWYGQPGCTGRAREVPHTGLRVDDAGGLKEAEVAAEAVAVAVAEAAAVVVEAVEEA